MIAEFTVENYRSFKERQTLSLISTKSNELSDSNTFEINGKVRFLKSAVLYGANAGGKSNFFYGLKFFLKFAVTSGPRKQAGDPIETEPFALSRQTEAAPSQFEIIFYVFDKNNEAIRYRYGFSVSPQKVEYEYLFAVNNIREVTLFTRQGREIECTAHFREGARGKPSVRENCTFLSVCAQNNGEISGRIIDYFRGIQVLSGLTDQVIFPKEAIEDPLYQKKIVNFLQFADIHILDMKMVEPVPAVSDNIQNQRTLYGGIFAVEKKAELFFGHAYYDGEEAAGQRYLPKNAESSGTQKLFSHSRSILRALENGSPVFIDEFDSLLHPLIVESIIKLFNSPLTNPKNAQFVVSCHAVNILTNKLLRRDQIWFCEKDRYGATSLYSLAEYKEPVRNDATFSKNYLQGKYGAIPYIDEIALHFGNKE
jgi:AAA15 family ATPase/GTPase